MGLENMPTLQAINSYCNVHMGSYWFFQSIWYMHNRLSNFIILSYYSSIAPITLLPEILTLIRHAPSNGLKVVYRHKQKVRDLKYI